MYQKSASDSSDGTNICSDTVASPQYSPDGNYIYYINASHGSVIYKKNANDSLCGSAITSASSLAGSLGGRIAVSPDGTQIVYTKNSDGKLYQKSSTDSLDGSAITSDQGNSATYSPDGSYIYYVNASHSTRIYKKNSNDTANGTQITTQGAIWPSVSPDGNSLIYTQNAGSFLIYKTSGASDGSAINSQFSFYTTYASNLSAPGSTPVTSTQNGMTCTTNQIPDISAVSWNNFGGIGTYSTISNSSTNPDTPDIGVVRSDSATLSRDIFAGFGFQSGSTVDTGSIVYPGTGTSALYWPNNPDPENPPFL